mgnify:CR=1 FL=1|tara:strand:- start:1742 stop:2749 length:1008 start_codon:yes stop_codon:yes gene_type:complete
MAEKQNNNNKALSMLNERGKLFSLKQELSQQIRSEQPGIDVEEFPVSMQSKENMNVFMEGSAVFKAGTMVEAKKQLGTPEYQTSVIQMNKIKQGFESMKNDLYHLADYKQKNYDRVGAVSMQEDLNDVEFLHDLVVLPDNLDKSVILNPNGSTIMGPNNEEIFIRDLPVLTPADVGRSIEEPLNDLIQQQGVNEKINGRDFNAQLVRYEIKNLLKNLKDNGGIKAVKSAAFDAVVNTGDFNGTFMDDYFNQEDITQSVDEFIKNNPTADIEHIKRTTLPSMWNEHNSGAMEKLLEDFYVVAAYDAYTSAKPMSNDRPTANMNDQEKVNYYTNLFK